MQVVVVWKEFGLDWIGAIGGYSGGGTFAFDPFMAIVQNGELTSFKSAADEHYDKLKREYIDFESDTPIQKMGICNYALEIALYFHDDKDFDESLYLRLKKRFESFFIKNGDMLFFMNAYDPILPELADCMGLLAAPNQCLSRHVLSRQSRAD